MSSKFEKDIRNNKIYREEIYLSQEINKTHFIQLKNCMKNF